MDEFIFVCFQFIFNYIVLADFDIGNSKLTKESDVDIRSHYFPFLSYTLGEPFYYRASTSSDFKTVPSFCNSQRFQAPESYRVKENLLRPETFEFIFVWSIVEKISLLTHDLPPL
jgi:hypothetical protein